MAVGHDEVVRVGRLLADQAVAVDMMSWEGWEEREVESALMLALYILRERASKAPQRRAMGLLRSWLTPEQRRELRVYRHVTVVGASGNRYRIIPATGNTQRVELHGRRWFAKASYCLHPDHWVPPADIALAHYLSIQADEVGFLRAANEHDRSGGLWDGAYLRRINAARMARALLLLNHCRNV